MIKLDYNELKKANKEKKLQLFREGKLNIFKRKPRTKPRNPIERKMLFKRAMDKMAKYPPRWISQNRLILPYFCDPEKNKEDDNNNSSPE